LYCIVLHCIVLHCITLNRHKLVGSYILPPVLVLECQACKNVRTTTTFYESDTPVDFISAEMSDNKLQLKFVNEIIYTFILKAIHLYQQQILSYLTGS